MHVVLFFIHPLIVLFVFCWFVYACISLQFIVICFLWGVQLTFIFFWWYFFLSLLVCISLVFIVVCWLFVLGLLLSFLFICCFFFLYDCVSLCIFVLGFYLLGMLLSFHLSNPMPVVSLLFFHQEILSSINSNGWMQLCCIYTNKRCCLFLLLCFSSVFHHVALVFSFFFSEHFDNPSLSTQFW